MTPDVDITMPPIDEAERDARAANPDDFALTYEESRAVLQATNIIESVLIQNDYITTNEATGARGYLINLESTQKIMDAFAAHGIDPNALYDLTTRVLGSSWYTLIPLETYNADQETTLCLVGNFDRKQGESILKSNPGKIYDGSSRAALRKELKIPADAKFLQSVEWSGLGTIRTVCNPQLSILETNYSPTVKGSTGLPADIIGNKFVPSINNALINDFVQMTKASMRKDALSSTAVYVTKNGHKLTATDFNKVIGSLSVSSNKLLIHAITYLLKTNYYKGHPRSVIPTVEMPLDEYARLTGVDIFPRTMPTPEEQEKENRRAEANLKKLKNDIKRDFGDIAELEWRGEERGNGPAAGDYDNLRLISRHRIWRGVIRVNFDIDVATYFLRSYLFQMPTALYSYDNRKPNAYAIAYKIAVHNSNDNNFLQGTNNTLSVSSLLDAAPEIPTIEKLQETNQRNWKVKIKGALEKALNESITKGFLSKWEYRDTKTGKTYSPDQANALTYLQWHRLMVDFIVIDAPDQTERRDARTEAKRAAAEAKATEPIKKKRGRPRKNPES